MSWKYRLSWRRLDDTFPTLLRSSPLKCVSIDPCTMARLSSLSNQIDSSEGEFMSCLLTPSLSNAPEHALCWCQLEDTFPTPPRGLHQKCASIDPSIMACSFFAVGAGWQHAPMDCLHPLWAALRKTRLPGLNRPFRPGLDHDVQRVHPSLSCMDPKTLEWLWTLAKMWTAYLWLWARARDTHGYEAVALVWSGEQQRPALVWHLLQGHAGAVHIWRAQDD